jgi:hypothetical protein
MSLLLPTKHSHPDKTIIAIATIILQRLKKVRLEQYDDLLDYLQNKNKNGEYLFLSAINFLYLLGLVEYHKKTDSFEYIEL